MSLTQTEINEAQAILTDTNLTQFQRVQNFYTYLINKGEDYGRLGLAVTNNDTWQGQIANGFVKSGAEDNGGGFEHGSQEWIDLNFTLANRHINAYVQNSGGVPTRIQIQTYHNDEYVLAGLDEDDWFVNKLLNDSSDSDALWSDYMQNTDITDLIEDALGVAQAGANLLFGPIYIREAYAGTPEEFAAEEAFAKNFLNALLELDEFGRADLILEVNDLSFKKLGDFLHNASDDFIHHIKQTGWALNHALDSGVDNLANWYNNAMGLFRHGIPQIRDPLIVDLDGDGVTIDTTISVGASNGDVYFDMDGDGFAEEVTWVNGNDGFFVYDANNNDRIDNGSELFGTDTVNGFDVLAAYDTNADGQIDNQDTIWGNLEIWQDSNADGITQNGELHSLYSYGIISIDVSNYVDNNSSFITHIGSAVTTGGVIEVANAGFARWESNTVYAQDYNFDVRAAFLPTLRGYNRMPAFHVALSLDYDESDPNSLMSLMTTIAAYSITELFENWDSVVATLEQVLFRWAGVESVDPASRGEFMEDARVLEFMEVYFGSNFVDPNEFTTNPGIVQARTIQDLWKDDLFAGFVANILMQTDAGRLFTNSEYRYDFDDVFTTGVNLSVIDELEMAATALPDTVARHDFWVGVAAFFSYAKATGSGTTTQGYLFLDDNSTELTYLDNAIQNSDSSLSWASISYDFENPEGEIITGTSNADSYLIDTQYQGGIEADTIIGLEGSDILHGGEGNDTLYGFSEDGIGDDEAADELYGGDGDDTLIGGDGDDLLYGNNGNDHLLGGAGNDFLTTQGTGAQSLLEGGEGDDKYIISTNNSFNNYQYIVDSSGIDTIRVYGAEISELALSRLGNDALQLKWGATRAVLTNQLQDLNFSQAIEYLEYYDNNINDYTSFDLINYLQNFTGSLQTNGTDNIDIINGILVGNQMDTIYAKAGDDIISGDSGDDFIYGEDGNDTLYGGSDDDLIDGGIGDDIISGDGGNDELYGRDGNDSFYASEGHDFIDGGTGTDTLLLPIGVTLQDITIVRDYGVSSYGTGILITFPNGSTISSIGQFTSGSGTDGGGGIEFLKFDDGSIVSLSSLEYETVGTSGDDILYGVTSGAASGNDVLYGYEGNDQLKGVSGNDILDGGDGNDSLDGASGDDTYIFSNGIDTIRESISQFDDNDVLDFGTFYSPEDLSFNIVNQYDVHIDTIDGNKVRIIDQFKSGYKQIDYYRFDGVDYDVLDPIFRYNAVGDGDLYGTQGDNTLIGGNGNNRLFAYDGDDVLGGGAGNDTLFGYGGNDIFIYTSGLDVFQEAGAGIGTIEFQAGVSIYDLVIQNSGTIDTLIILDPGIDEVKLESHRHSNKQNNQFEYLEFDDGLKLLLDGYNGWQWGTVGSDQIDGNSTSNTILGDLGDDTLNGHEGNDQIDGGIGNDFASGGIGNDYIFGGLGVDSLFGDDGDDILYSGDGVGIDHPEPPPAIQYPWRVDDSLFGGNGNDTLYAGDIDLSNSPAGYDADIFYLNGGEGDDVLHSGSGGAKLEGGKGHDIAYGNGAAANYIYNLGDDTFTIDQGAGYRGKITFHGVSFANLSFETSSQNATLAADTVRIIVNGDNTQYLDVLNVLVDDGQGNIDTFVPYLEFESGFYELIHINDPDYGTGQSTVGDFDVIEVVYSPTPDQKVATEANDVIAGVSSINALGGHDVIKGTDNDDSNNGGTGNDYLYGFSGNDVLYGGAGDDTLYGGIGDDDLRGQDGIDTIYAGEGDDFILGGAGDTIYGEAGNDVMRGYGGTGVFDGGEGTDKAWWRDYQHAGSVGLNINLTEGTATDGDNLIATISNVEDVIGSVYSDTLIGDSNANVIRGGSDRFGLLDGNDTLHGKGGADTLYGDKGDDVLIGGDGFDKLFGNAGADTFVFEAANAYNDRDDIRDFSLADGDKIDLSDLLAGYDPLNDLITDFVQITDNGTHSYVAVDADGGADNFLQVAQIVSVTGLTDEATLESNGTLIV